MSANIQSPGSPSSCKGSKSSSGLDDLYFSLSNDNHLMMKYAGFNNFSNNNNVGANYFADVDPNVEMGLEDIDEIDTNNMAIYSGESGKKARGKELFATSSNGSDLLKRQEGKQQAQAVVVPQKTTQGKSLIKNEGKGKVLPEINIEVNSDNAASDDNDVLAQAIDAANISPNSMAGQSVISNFDETSRVSLNDLKF